MAYEGVKEREIGGVEEEFKPLKESLVMNTEDVCGKRYVGGGIRKGSEGWNEEMKYKVDEKKENSSVLIENCMKN